MNFFLQWFKNSTMCKKKAVGPWQNPEEPGIISSGMPPPWLIQPWCWGTRVIPLIKHTLVFLLYVLSHVWPAEVLEYCFINTLWVRPQIHNGCKSTLSRFYVFFFFGKIIVLFHLRNNNYYHIIVVINESNIIIIIIIVIIIAAVLNILDCYIIHQKEQMAEMGLVTFLQVDGQKLLLMSFLLGSDFSHLNAAELLLS